MVENSPNPPPPNPGPSRYLAGREEYSQPDSGLVDLDGAQWYQLPLEARQKIVDRYRHDPEKIAQLAREIGPNTGTTSVFGRSSRILMQTLPIIRSSQAGDRLQVLDVGPGLALPTLVEMCGYHKQPVEDPRVARHFSYEPFELVAALQRVGFTRMQLTAFDIDPLVLAVVATQTSLVTECYKNTDPEYYASFQAEVDPDAQPVLNPEIGFVNRRNTQYPQEHYTQAHLVRIPERIRHAVRTQPGSIEAKLEPTGQYDLAYCLAVTPYLQDEAASLHHLVATLRPGGLLVTGVVNNPKEYGLEEQTRVKWRRDTVCYKKAAPYAG